MAKDENMPSKKEITQFLVHVEQLVEGDEVFQEKLGNFLRKIAVRTSVQNNTLPVQIQESGSQIQEKIVYKDKIIEKIVYQDKIVEKRVEVPVERIVEKHIEVTPQWAKSLESEFTFLKHVQAHPELISILLPNANSHVLQLITIAAQWNSVLRVWDALATQIKNTQQSISATEQQILEHSLVLFNLTLQSNQATLRNPKSGESYDYEIHQKVSGSGGSIEQVLLAGLYNAAGENVRAAIVTTR
ncbi:hypothetical protein [Acinetobacter radioresistens]|uniref:hypothetical protein n=1 Tax=Acinetobacter radioresistens TaxID=40216 RepID=UPI003215CC58